MHNMVQPPHPWNLPAGGSDEYWHHRPCCWKPRWLLPHDSLRGLQGVNTEWVNHIDCHKLIHLWCRTPWFGPSMMRMIPCLQLPIQTLQTLTVSVPEFRYVHILYIILHEPWVHAILHTTMSSWSPLWGRAEIAQLRRAAEISEHVIQQIDAHMVEIEDMVEETAAVEVVT